MSVPLLSRYICGYKYKLYSKICGVCYSESDIDKLFQMFLVLFLVQLAFVTVPAVIFQDCGSAYDLEAVEIQGCGWSLPCYVTLGEEIPVNVKFFADFSSNLLDQDVVINVNLVNVNAEVTPDPCVTVECPVTTGAANTFTSVMSVPNVMALNQRGFLNWRVYNERKRLVLCYSVLVQTQNSKQKQLRQLLSEITPQHANAIVDNLNFDTLNDRTKPLVTTDYLQQLIYLYHANLEQNDTRTTKEEMANEI